MLGRAVLFTLVPVAAAAVPGCVAAFRPPGERLTSALQHFAAGVVFAAATIELLPDVLQQSPVVAISGFAVGIAVMFSFRAVSERIERAREARDEQDLPVGLLAATASTSSSTASSWAPASPPAAPWECC